MVPFSSRIRAVAVAVIATVLAGCVQPVHRGTESRAAPPGDVLRLVEASHGRGSPVRPGDLVTVDLIGKYGDGTEWAHGSFTWIYSDGAWPGSDGVTRIGDRYRMEWLGAPAGRRPRFLTLSGGVFPEREAYRIRRDRGPVLVEHTVTSWCRPMKLVVMDQGILNLVFPLGCWKYPRLAAPTVGRTPGAGNPPAPQRRETESAEDSALVAAAAAGSLHAAAILGQADKVGQLLRAAGRVDALDSLGMTPLLRVALAQLPAATYDPERERGQLAVVDTLLAHGASLAVRVPMEGSLPMVGPEHLVRGATALDLVARGCADAFARRLLAAGADVVNMIGNESGLMAAVLEGCPEMVDALLDAGAPVDKGGVGSIALERLAGVTWYFDAHVAVARRLLEAGATPGRARQFLEERLDNPGPGSFGFYNRPVARRVLKLLP